MRLTAEQRVIIRAAGVEIFGEGVDVRLFGSRVDDEKRGGDIDILVVIPEPVNQPALLSAKLSAKVSRQLQGCKVDVLLSAPNLMHLPIHDVAFKEGIKL